MSRQNPCACMSAYYKILRSFLTKNPDVRANNADVFATMIANLILHYIHNILAGAQRRLRPTPPTLRVAPSPPPRPFFGTAAPDNHCMPPFLHVFLPCPYSRSRVPVVRFPLGTLLSSFRVFCFDVSHSPQPTGPVTTPALPLSAPGSSLGRVQETVG